MLASSCLLLGQRLHKHPHLQQPRSGCMWQVMAAFPMSNDSLSHGVGLLWAVPAQRSSSASSHGS